MPVCDDPNPEMRSELAKVADFCIVTEVLRPFEYFLLLSVV